MESLESIQQPGGLRLQLEKQSGVCGVGSAGEEYASVTCVCDLRLLWSVGVRKQRGSGISCAGSRVSG